MIGLVKNMPYKKKFQVFISSTFTDLQEERRKVQDIVLKMNHFPVGMELFSAASEDQWSIIQKTINSSDYYVLIVGYRYGSETDEGISYTQKEYEYAKKSDLPILAFLKQDGIPSTPDERESSRGKQKKLQKFIDDVKTGRLVEWWSNEEELGQKVMNSLYKEFDMSPRPGWVRANSVEIEEIQLELVRQNKKIRDLEEENKTLRAQISSRFPTFELLINNLDYLELQLAEWQGENMIRAEYMPIDIEEYRAQGTSEEHLAKYEKYNSSLPNEETLSDYIEARKYYDLSKNHAVPITISIGNSGTSKASNVIIELKFPNSLIIYDQDSLDNLTEPHKPPRGKTPYEELLEKMNKVPSWMYNLHPKSHLPSIPYAKLNTSLLLGHEGNTESIEKNVLYIRHSQIMHTSRSILSGYYVVPLKAGIFGIKASIICEEIPKKEEFIFSVVVHDK